MDKSKTVCLNEPTVLSTAFELMEQFHQPPLPVSGKQDFKNNDSVVKKLRTWASEKDCLGLTPEYATYCSGYLGKIPHFMVPQFPAKWGDITYLPHSVSVKIK